MKTLLRIVFVLLALLLLAAAAGLAFRDTLAKRMLVRSLRQTSGLEVEIGAVRTGARPVSLQVRSLHIKNPPGFDEEEGFRIDELFVSVERRTLFTDEVRLPEVRIRMPRLVVLQDAQGRTNLEQLGRRVSRARTPEAAPPGRPPEDAPSSIPDPDRPEAPPPPRSVERSFRIDRLEIYVGELELREFPRGGAPRIMLLPIDREMVFEDVTDLEPVLQQLMVQWAAASLPSLLEQVREEGDGDALRGLQEMLRRNRRARREARAESSAADDR